MSAFDEARSGGRSAPSSRTGMARGGGGVTNSPRTNTATSSSSSAFASVASSNTTGLGSSGGSNTASYQSGDRLYMSTCDTIDKELRKLTSTVAAAKKQIDTIGTAKDTDDQRKKLTANLEKGKESVKIVSNLLKGELASAVESADNQRERNSRKMQQSRYQKDFRDAMEAFQSAANSATDAQRKHPKPVGGTGVSIDANQTAPGGGGGGKKSNKNNNNSSVPGEDDALLARMQQVDFDAAMIEERDEAITDIASAIMEVNETMRDLAQIVEDQGHDIDQIEVNVTEAEDSTAKGVEHLTTAEKYQKGYRKWIFVLIAIILLAAGGITAYFVLSKNHPQ